MHHGEATLTFPQTIYLRYALLEAPERRQLSVAEDYKVWFLARLRLVDQALADGRNYLTGGCFTMADVSVCYAAFLAMEIGLGSNLPEGVSRWAQNLMRRPAFQSAQQRQSEAAEAAGILKATVPQ